jgi:hydrogenase-4 component E
MAPPGIFAAQLPPIAGAIFSLLAITSLLLTFVMLGSRWLSQYLLAFTAQSWLIALLSGAVGFYGDYPELYGIAALTAIFRGLVLPYLLRRIIRRLEVDRELHERLAPSSSLVAGALLVVFAFVVSTHLGESLGLSGTAAVLALTVMLSMKLIGFLMLMVRSEVISQILAILVLENGIFLGSQILVPGMPLLIELVILFDLLVVVACFGVLVRYLIVHAGTSSTRELRRLTG